MRYTLENILKDIKSTVLSKQRMRKHMNDIQKAKAIAWYQEHVKQDEIANRLKVSKRAVERLFAKHKRGPVYLIPGRPKKLTKVDICRIKKAIEKNPMMTSKDLKIKLSLKNISTRTIRRVLLVDLKMPSFVATKKPLLTKRMKETRLKFARKYIKWNSRMWSKCLFTDESEFETISGRKYKRVRRRKDEDKYQDKYIQRVVKHPAKTMIWASVCARGFGNIFFLPQNSRMNSSIYHDVIKDYLLPTMSKYRCLLFLQDNASPHTSKQTSSYLKQNNIQTLYLPASSPDLNVIENTFNFLKYQLESEDTSTLPNLKKAIKKCVGKLKRSYFENLCLSMPTRLREVIKRKGDMTHY